MNEWHGLPILGVFTAIAQQSWCICCALQVICGEVSFLPQLLGVREGWWGDPKPGWCILMRASFAPERMSSEFATFATSCGNDQNVRQFLGHSSLTNMAKTIWFCLSHFQADTLFMMVRRRNHPKMTVYTGLGLQILKQMDPARQDKQLFVGGPTNPVRLVTLATCNNRCVSMAYPYHQHE